MSASASPAVGDRLKKPGSTYLPPRPGRRRDKPQLSCSSCKQRKLKCDRKQPCETCVKRGHAGTCFYVPFNGKPSAASQAASASNGAIQAKIRDLESMVVSLMKAQKDDGSEAHDVEEDSGRESYDPADDSVDDSLAEAYGRIDLENSNARYVDSSHWMAVLDGIAELKDHFEDVQTPESSGTSEVNLPVHVRPNLLFSARSNLSREEILNSLPDRPIVDRLVSKWFTELEMQPGVIHPQTFIKEYDRFWQDRDSLSITWVGVLFSILSGSSHFYALAEADAQTHSESVKAYQKMEDEYRELAANCLVYADYTNPGEYTVEALIMYFSNEHFRSRDGQFGNFLTFSMLVRVAMRMGYHRDASHYKNISVFQGEMRRRVWAVIVQLDVSTSAQMGLPRMIQDFHWDTTSPRNIADCDFDENSTELPASRPESANTNISYAGIKIRSVRILGKINDVSTSTKPVPYSRVLKLDEELRKTEESLPASLVHRSIAQSLADTPNMILRRFYLDLNFQKARCLLHQRYSVQARHDKQYQGSRKACIEAAMRLLEHQLVFYQETRPGGRLFLEKWKMSSFLSNDYFLAATILCVDLDHRLAPEYAENETENGLKWSREDQIQALSTAHDIWLLSGKTSAEAHKIALALGIMLQKLGRESAATPVSRPAQSPKEHTDSPNGDVSASVLDNRREGPQYQLQATTSPSSNQFQFPTFRPSPSVFQPSPPTSGAPANLWLTSAVASNEPTPHPLDFNITGSTRAPGGGIDSMLDMPLQPQWDLWNNNVGLMDVDPSQGDAMGYTPDWAWDGFQEGYTDDVNQELKWWLHEGTD